MLVLERGGETLRAAYQTYSKRFTTLSRSFRTRLIIIFGGV